MNGGNEVPNYLRVRMFRNRQTLDVALPAELTTDNRILAWRKIAKWRRQKGWRSAIPVHSKDGLCPYTNFCVVYNIPCDEINWYVYDLLQQQQVITG